MRAAVILVIVAILLGIVAAYAPLVALGAALALLIVPGAVRRPYLAGIALFVWGGVRFAVLEAAHVSGLAASAVELLILLAVVAAAMARGRRDHWVLKARLPWILMGLFVIESLVSWAVNHGSVIDLVSGLRGMLILPALAVSTVLLVKDADRDRSIAWTAACWFTYLQIPIAFWQYFFAGGSTVDPDRVVGTLGMGGANVLGVLMLALLMHSVSLFSKTRRYVLLLGALAALVVILMCSARLPLLLSPVGALLVFTTEKGSGSIGRRIAIVVAALLLVGPIFYFVLPAYRADLGGGFNPSALVREQMVIEPGRVPRLAYIAYGWNFVRTHSAFDPVGVGPGSAASGAAASLGTPMSVEFATGLRLAAAGTVSRLDAPVFIPYPTQLTAMLVEYGPVGLVIYAAFVVSIGIVILKRCLLGDHPGADWRVFILWFAFMSFGAVYANPWEGFTFLGIGFYATMLFLKPTDNEVAHGV